MKSVLTLILFFTCQLMFSYSISAQENAAVVIESFRQAVGPQSEIDRVKNLYALADCQGPKDKYTTEIHSATGDRTIFKQTTAKGEVYIGQTNGKIFWTKGSEIKLADAKSAFVWRSHEFQWIALHLLERFRSPKLIGYEDFLGQKAIKLSALDELDRPAELFFDEQTKLLRGFLISDPFSEKPETIRLVFNEWKRIENLLLPTRITATDKQGDFILNFHTIRLNQIDEKIFEVPPKVSAIKELLEIHRLQRVAHFERDANLFDSKLPFSAGFRTLRLSDETRSFRFNAERLPVARPIHLFVWYPAAKPKKPDFLRFGDYVYASHLTKSADRLTAEEKAALRQKLVATLEFFEVNEEQADFLMNAVTNAVGNAPEQKKRFPLIVLGNVGDGFHLTATAEFLAASGFVVVSLPSLGANEDERCGFDLNCFRLQQTDLELAIEKMRSLPNVDSARIGLLAWSFSGLAAAQISVKNPQIKAVVSLDAATGYQYGKELLDQLKEFEMDKTRVPFLHLHGLGGQSRVVKNFDFFNAYRSTEKLLVAFKNLQHADFASLYGQGVRYAKKDNNLKAFEAIRWANLLTRHFFNARLKNNRKSQKILDGFLRNNDKTVADIFSFSAFYPN